jgi:hypothetical protein
MQASSTYQFACTTHSRHSWACGRLIESGEQAIVDWWNSIGMQITIPAIVNRVLDYY